MALPKAQLESIRKNVRDGLKLLEQAESDIQDAQRAGLDVTELRKEQARQRQQLFMIRTVYGE